VPITRNQLFHRSRDPRLLLRVAASIGLLGFLVGFAISHFTAHTDKRPFLFESPIEPGSGLPNAHDWLPPSGASFDLWTDFIRFFDPSEPESDTGSFERLLPGGKEPPSAEEILNRVKRALGKSTLPEPERALLGDLLAALHETDDALIAAALERLRAASESSRRHAAEFHGDALRYENRIEEAINAYQLELDRFPADSEYSLHWLAELLAAEGRTDERDALMDSPEFGPQFSVSDRLNRAVDRRDYLQMAKFTLLRDLVIDDPWLALLSVFAAAIWFAIVTQFAGQQRERLFGYAIAMILGYLSATLTLYAVLVQENIRGFAFDFESDPTTQLIYCIAGIGLREETLKLLCFVPMVPWLVRRGSQIDALVCAGLVGLGFALNENISYVEKGGAFTAWGRFLSANFLHVALTGIAGLALVRAWRWPKRQWDNFLYDFLIVVAAHGGYDALLMMPALVDYDFVSLIILALVAYFYLDRAIEHMEPRGAMRVSPLAVFVVGGAALIAVTFCFACWAMPFPLALADYALALAYVVPFAFIFINRLRHL
jgi:RsiW-degrading membrane proteinase PrsW (M82 family)